MASILEVDIEPDPRSLRRVRRELGRLGEKQAPRALNRAVKDTVRNARVIVVKETAADLAVPQKAIYKRGSRTSPVQEIIFRDRGRFATGGQVVAESIASDPQRGRIRLGNMKARRMARGGVTYQVERGGGRKRITDAFLIERGSFRGVFRRGPDGRMFQLYGPSVAYVAQQRPKVQQLARGGVDRLFERNVDSQISRFTDR